ncbi:MAG: UvrD-helicase domain-containing protein, partial [Coriobacteriia bacterium]|nr:UvrD-helicase domain-containing protein [Coriobacteriia bacterium]
MPTLAQRLGVNEPNSEQLAAINAIDGPVLVVAGPGTGKTQLLGLRFVNILAERDIDASNILCLTYMEAGAEAMRKRLLDFIGRDAYLAEISTFHGFCRMLRSRYPEYFALGAFESLVTNLEKAKLINQILRDLPLGDPLYGKSLGEVSPNYGSFDSFVSHFKRSGLSTAELRAIAQQNLDFFDYIDHQSRLPELLAIDLKTAKKGEKIERVEEVLEYLRALDGLLPASLSTPVTGLPGSYEPYVRYLVRRFTESELYSDAGAKGRFTVFGNLRKELFELAEGAVGTGGGGTGGTAADGTAADGGTGGAGTAADGAAAGGGVAPDPANSARWVCKQQERRTAKRLL